VVNYVGIDWAYRQAQWCALAPGGEIAWLDEQLESKSLGMMRGTGVLVRTGPNEWRVAHYSWSILVPNDRVDAVKKAIDAPPASP
jgi:hypothetical protein